MTQRNPTLPPWGGSIFERYSVPFIVVGAALLFKLLLAPLMDQPPFLLFLGAVMIAAWNGGLGPGLLATTLSLVLSHVFFLASADPLRPLTLDEGLSLGLFLLEAVIICWLGAAHVRAERARRVSDLQRATAEADRRTSESGLRAILDSALDAVIGMDSGGRIIFWNPRAEAIFGWTASQAIGRALNELIIPPTDRAAHRDGLAHFLRTGEGRLLNRRVELRGMRRDRSTFPLELSVTALRVGETWRFNAFAADITERKITEQGRLEMLQREQAARLDAELANRTKDEFLATLSHELRTPLNAIVGWAHLLRSGGLDAATAARAIETIERNARVQNQLIGDILEVSRIIAGKLRLNVAPVDMLTVVNAALDTVRPTADAKQVRLESDLDSTLPPVAGDPDRLQQVIWNLLSNAIKFTPSEGRVRLRVARSGANVEIAVEDTGCGISSDFLPHVFERFRQGDSSTTRPHGGLGLGLAIVRHLVELHGGTVASASPGEDQGATFRVTLPLTRSTVEPSPGATTAACDPPRARPAIQLEGVEVLVVDDEPDTRELITRILNDHGVRVRAAASASEALDAVRERIPDVILSDIEMPGEDGYTFMRELRVRPAEQGGRIPAGALTAYAREEDQQRALHAGFQMHLAKPINPEELVAVTASLAGRTTVPSLAGA